ncbi:hypothetical protein CERZMDRAFT_44756, partial [Cercospora zeae-maydis SCOH1-5]
EGRALQIAYKSQLPVPLVHELTTSASGTDILMDFVEGECLEEAWPNMTEGEKTSIAKQLGVIVTRMRQVTPDQREISAFGSPIRDLRRFSDYNGGPFQTEEEFNEFVVDLYQLTPSLIRSALSGSLPKDSRIVLSHCDLSPRNIIVKEGRIQALLDWEYAGWYPEYWEYVKFFDRTTSCQDWKHFAEHVFDVQYPRELLAYQAILRWQQQ